MLPKLFILHLSFVMVKEITITISKLFKKSAERSPLNITCCIMIILFPDVHKHIDISSCNWQSESWVHSTVGVYDNGNKQIQENVAYHKEEDYKVGNGRRWTTAVCISVVQHSWFIVSILITLESDTSLPSCIEHKCIPTFACSTSN